jgi:hypothetical protein
MQVTELRKEGEVPARHEAEPSRMFIVLLDAIGKLHENPGGAAD